MCFPFMTDGRLEEGTKVSLIKFYCYKNGFAEQFISLNCFKCWRICFDFQFGISNVSKLLFTAYMLIEKATKKGQCSPPRYQV